MTRIFEKYNLEIIQKEKLVDADTLLRVNNCLNDINNIDYKRLGSLVLYRSSITDIIKSYKLNNILKTQWMK